MHPSGSDAAVMETSAGAGASAHLSPQPLASRRYDLDWLRVLAMGGVFFFHCARFFDTVPWHVKNAEHSDAAFAFIGFMALWQMPLLMLLAGAGSWFALESRTAVQYLAERALRLLVPLYTVGLFVLIPPQYYWDRVTLGLFHATFAEFYPSFLKSVELQPGLSFLEFWPGHLWFLRRLFTYCLIGLPVLLYLKSAGGRRLIARLAGWCDRWGGPFLFCLPLAVVRVGLRVLWPGRDDNDPFAYLLAYFLIGYVIVADERFTRSILRHRVAGGLVGMACFGVLLCLIFGLGMKPWESAAFSPSDVWFYTLVSVNAWSWVLLWLGLATRRLNFTSPALRYANEAVLPFYVLHQTIILAVGRYVVRWQTGMPAKYAVIAVVSLVLILGLYELLIRRVRWLRLLFGMRAAKPAVRG